MGLFDWFHQQKYNTGGPVTAREFIGIPVATLLRDVTEFVGKLETEESAKWCKCLWRIHPDDQWVPERGCRICGDKHKHHTEGHQFRGVRKVQIDNHPNCPVHTKEGLIIGFIEWAEKNGN